MICQLLPFYVYFYTVLFVYFFRIKVDCKKKKSDIFNRKLKMSFKPDQIPERIHFKTSFRYLKIKYSSYV